MMREFGTPVGARERAEILAMAEALYLRAEPKRDRRASEFAMEDEGDPVVAHEIDVRWDEGRLRVGKTEASARPPFEWLVEITSDIGETDYFKHYLIRTDDIVLAQRKVLTPIDALEARIIMNDLRAARESLL